MNIFCLQFVKWLFLSKCVTLCFQPKLSMAKCRRNVENFLDACRKIGVPEVRHATSYNNPPTLLVLWQQYGRLSELGVALRFLLISSKSYHKLIFWYDTKHRRLLSNWKILCAKCKKHVCWWYYVHTVAAPVSAFPSWRGVIIKLINQSIFSCREEVFKLWGFLPGGVQDSWWR